MEITGGMPEVAIGSTKPVGLEEGAILTESLFQVHKNNRAIVTVSPEGKVTFGEGYNPDTAARAFWGAMSETALLVRHDQAVRLIYEEACVGFRDAKTETERWGWDRLCISLECTYPGILSNVREGKNDNAHR